MKGKKNLKKESGSKRQLKILLDKVRFWVVIFLCISFILLAISGKIEKLWKEYTQTFYTFTANYGFKYNNLVISSIKNTPKSEIISAIQVRSGSPLLAININTIQARLKELAWVKAAIVERRFPDTLYIGILERKPIAVWQNNYKMYLIDNEGFVIPVDDIGNFSNLILVVGSDAPVYTKKLIQDINMHPALAKHVISATRYGERRWNLTLKENITIKMPESDFKKAWNYLEKLYSKDKLFNNNYKTLDLRDHQKYYIEKY
jgi:cell division protein FtsQ